MSGATRDAASLCRVLEKTEQGVGEGHEGWPEGQFPSFLNSQPQGALARGHLPLLPPVGTGEPSGMCPRGVLKEEQIRVHLPRTGAKSPGLSALLEAKGLMEGRTMRAKEKSRTWWRCGRGHPIPPQPQSTLKQENRSPED